MPVLEERADKPIAGKRHMLHSIPGGVKNLCKTYAGSGVRPDQFVATIDKC